MIAGSGTDEYLEKLRNMIEKDNIENVNFLGYIENREEFFNNIDIFVFPSFFRGFRFGTTRSHEFLKDLHNKKYFANDKLY